MFEILYSTYFDWMRSDDQSKEEKQYRKGQFHGALRLWVFMTMEKEGVGGDHYSRIYNETLEQLRTRYAAWHYSEVK